MLRHAQHALSPSKGGFEPGMEVLQTQGRRSLSRCLVLHSGWPLIGVLPRFSAGSVLNLLFPVSGGSFVGLLRNKLSN